MQSKYQTVEQMHERLLAMIRSRHDTGFRVGAEDTIFEPRNPFESKKNRTPKASWVIVTGLALLLIAVFLYFSFRW